MVYFWLIKHYQISQDPKTLIILNTEVNVNYVHLRKMNEKKIILFNPLTQVQGHGVGSGQWGGKRSPSHQFWEPDRTYPGQDTLPQQGHSPPTHTLLGRVS